MASCHIIDGPMMAGKTEELMRLATREAIAGRSVLVVNYEADAKRYSAGKDYVVSHSGRRHPAVSCTRLSDVVARMKEVDFVGINEAQFFADAPEVVWELMTKHKKTVAVAGLNGDANQKPWPVMSRLHAMRTQHTAISAICPSPCGNEANFTIRLQPDLSSSSSSSSSSNAIDIGGMEKYRAVCLDCLTRSASK
jgi:thymidine kinase